MTALWGDVEQRVAIFCSPLGGLLPLSRFEQPRYQDTSSYRKLAQLGCLCISLDTAIGGSGLSWAEEALVFERLGRQLISPNLVAGAIAAHMAAEANDRPMAKAIYAGDWQIAFAVSADDGHRALLYDAPAADLLLLREGGRLTLQPNKIVGERPKASSKNGIYIEKVVLERRDILIASDQLMRHLEVLVASQLLGLAYAKAAPLIDFRHARALESLSATAKAIQDTDPVAEWLGAQLIEKAQAMVDAPVSAERTAISVLTDNRALLWKALAHA